MHDDDPKPPVPGGCFGCLGDIGPLAIALLILAGALIYRGHSTPKPLLIDAAVVAPVHRAAARIADDQPGVPMCPMPPDGPLVIVPPAPPRPAPEPPSLEAGNLPGLTIA